MKRILLLTGALGIGALSGCLQSDPPSQKQLDKLFAQRLMAGPRYTRMEAWSQPQPPVTGSPSIWELKVCTPQNAPDGTHPEWQYFHPLPTNDASQNGTQVLMDAWMISRDGNLVLPGKPELKEYGTFICAWTFPHAGAYTLFTEYQPAFQDANNPLARSKVLPVEYAHKALVVRGAGPLPSAAQWVPSAVKGGSIDAGTGSASIRVRVSVAQPHVGQPVTYSLPVSWHPHPLDTPHLITYAAAGDIFEQIFADDGRSFQGSFPKPGLYEVWVCAQGLGDQNRPPSFVVRVVA